MSVRLSFCLVVFLSENFCIVISLLVDLSVCLCFSRLCLPLFGFLAGIFSSTVYSPVWLIDWLTNSLIAGMLACLSICVSMCRPTGPYRLSDRMTDSLNVCLLYFSLSVSFCLQMTDNWNLNINNGNICVAVFVDFEKAFDIVDLNILVSKLKTVRAIAERWELANNSVVFVWGATSHIL